MVDLVPVDEETDIQELKTLIEKHAKFTGSTVAEKILKDWPNVLGRFVKIYPKDYRFVLEAAAKAAAGTDPASQEVSHG
jgi:glutamate synthase domain-containing protein 3